MKLNFDISMTEFNAIMTGFRTTERDLAQVRGDLAMTVIKLAEVAGENRTLRNQVDNLKYDVGQRDRTIKNLDAEILRLQNELAMTNPPDRVGFMRNMLSTVHALASDMSYPSYSGPNVAEGSELLRHARRGEKIQCIKIVREFTGLGLKEAKELVEEKLFPYKAAAE